MDWGNPLEPALSLHEDVSSGAVAAEGVELVGGVGGTDIADGADEEEAVCTLAPLVLIHLVLAADGVVGVELDALLVIHVVAEDADALAEDVVVYLVDGTVDVAGSGGVGRGVAAIGDEGNWGGSWAVASMGDGLLTCAVDVLVALAVD